MKRKLLFSSVSQAILLAETEKSQVMAEAYEIVRQVQERFAGLAASLARITGKVTETFLSHAREPKTQNPLSSGNASPATHYVLYLRINEAAVKGAGKMMNRRVYEDMEAEFADGECTEISQQDLHAGVLSESFDVLNCLNKFDFQHLSNSELKAMKEEGAQLRDTASDYVSHIEAILRTRK